MQKGIESLSTIDLSCHHCGDVCDDDGIYIDDYIFCCHGCQSVYQILSDHELSNYYQYATTPGVSRRREGEKTYEYLDDSEIVHRLTTFSEGSLSRVQLELPQIHCSACIWLLEHLHQINDGIRNVTVRFAKRIAHITFDHTRISLRSLVELLDDIGYAPKIHLELLDKGKKTTEIDKVLLYKIGIAGFCFGNIMLLSFPEYLGFKHASHLFYLGYVNIILSTPVLVYAGADYLKSAWKSIVKGRLNVDVPIAIGILALYIRSIVEIISGLGEGYLDSMAGLVFFLLIGRWFQSMTYRSLDFNRNYTAYFPIAATVKCAKEWITKPLQKVMPGDHLLIRNRELIPADGILKIGKGRMDYSFVTGESDIISKEVGDLLYAGGRHMGESIEMVVTKKVDQSYLTQLWSDDIFKHQSISDTSKTVTTISKYFTLVIGMIAVVSFAMWSHIGAGKAIEIFTSVLIVACPCALALSIPFTYGNIMRLLANRGLYLRNVSTIEHLQEIDTIIFDKTGTLTDPHELAIQYHGRVLTEEEKSLIKSGCFHSSHPMSKAVVRHLASQSIIEVDYYKDHIGMGYVARIGTHELKVGSSAYIFGTATSHQQSGVFIEINDEYLGHFKCNHAFRNGASKLIERLGAQYEIGMISGDGQQDKERILSLMPTAKIVSFNQKPKDKLRVIKDLQEEGHKVMMIGDGLNDAGALKQSDVGIVISDAVNNFSPSCDGILAADQFSHLGKYLLYFRCAKRVLYGAFAISLIYNIVGLYYATTGQLSPVVAAILMPLSSITVIVYGVVLSYGVFAWLFANDKTEPSNQ